MPPGCCGDISIFAELEDTFDTAVQIYSNILILSILSDINGGYMHLADNRAIPSRKCSIKVPAK